GRGLAPLALALALRIDVGPLARPRPARPPLVHGQELDGAHGQERHPLHARHPGARGGLPGERGVTRGCIAWICAALKRQEALRGGALEVGALDVNGSPCWLFLARRRFPWYVGVD